MSLDNTNSQPQAVNNQSASSADAPIVAAKGKRGFASMNPEKQRAIASKGGRSAHAKGKAHEFTQEEARVAGRKGGLARGKKSASTQE